MSRKPSVAQARRFQKDLAFFTDELLPEQVLTFTKALSMHILRGVIHKTPVGNPSRWKRRAPKGYVGGHARLNWQVTLDMPAENVVDGQDESGMTAEMGGLLSLSSARAFQRVWIVNNVPYILVLEHGRATDERGVMRGSTQAPHGMLGVTMEEVRRDFRAR